MKVIEGADPDVTELRGSGRTAAPVGWTCLIVGVVWCAALLVLPLPIESWVRNCGLLIGLAFLVAGAVAVSSRRGITIDRKLRTLTKWWGLFVPMLRTTVSLDALTSVSITEKLSQSDQTSVAFPVRIMGPANPLRLDRPRDYQKARALAKQIARLLALPIEDSTGGTSVVRQASELDESIRDRARRTGETVELPDPPAGMKTAVECGADRIRLDLPRPPIRSAKLLAIVGLAAGLAILLVFLIPAIWEWDKGAIWFFCDDLVSFCLQIGLILIVEIGLFAAALRRPRIIVTPDLLRVERRSPLFSKAEEIPAHELDDLELCNASVGRGADAQPSCITARSDRVTITFGEHLAPEERAWVYAVVRNMLTI